MKNFNLDYETHKLFYIIESDNEVLENSINEAFNPITIIKLRNNYKKLKKAISKNFEYEIEKLQYKMAWSNEDPEEKTTQEEKNTIEEGITKKIELLNTQIEDIEKRFDELIKGAEGELAKDLGAYYKSSAKIEATDDFLPKIEKVYSELYGTSSDQYEKLKERIAKNKEDKAKKLKEKEELEASAKIAKEKADAAKKIETKTEEPKKEEKPETKTEETKKETPKAEPAKESGKESKEELEKQISELKNEILGKDGLNTKIGGLKIQINSLDAKKDKDKIAELNAKLKELEDSKSSNQELIDDLTAELESK